MKSVRSVESGSFCASDEFGLLRAAIESAEVRESKVSQACTETWSDMMMVRDDPRGLVTRSRRHSFSDAPRPSQVVSRDDQFAQAQTVHCHCPFSRAASAQKFTYKPFPVQSTPILPFILSQSPSLISPSSYSTPTHPFSLHLSRLNIRLKAFSGTFASCGGSRRQDRSRRERTSL